MCAYESGRARVHSTVTVVLLIILQCVSTFAMFEFTQVPVVTTFIKGGNITLKWTYSTDETVTGKVYFFALPPAPQKTVMIDREPQPPAYTDRAFEGGQGNEAILVITQAMDSDAGDYRLYIQMEPDPKENTAYGISIIDPATLLEPLWSWGGEAVSGDTLVATAGQTYSLSATIKPSSLGLEAVLLATWDVNNLKSKQCNNTCGVDVTFDSEGLTTLTAELHFSGSMVKKSETFTVTIVASPDDTTVTQNSEDGSCAANPACIGPIIFFVLLAVLIFLWTLVWHLKVKKDDDGCKANCISFVCCPCTLLKDCHCSQGMQAKDQGTNPAEGSPLTQPV